jgi:hypothetical protein
MLHKYCFLVGKLKKNFLLSSTRDNTLSIVIAAAKKCREEYSCYSIFTGLIYYWSRQRSGDIDLLISKLERLQENGSSPDDFVALQDFFRMGGWSTTSANTVLLSEILMRISSLNPKEKVREQIADNYPSILAELLSRISFLATQGAPKSSLSDSVGGFSRSCQKFATT